MAGYYDPYPVTVQLLQKHKFCSLDEFLNFINTFEHYDINGKSHSKAIRDAFITWLRTNPFGRNTRFPNNFHVHIDCAKIRSITNQFFSSLARLELFEENKVNSTSANRIEYINNAANAKQSCVEALSKWADIIKNTNLEELAENGVYCRETFEQKYGLRWVPKDDHSRR